MLISENKQIQTHLCVFGGIDAIFLEMNHECVCEFYGYKYESNRLCIYLYIIIMYILCLRFNFVDSKRWCLNWNSYAIKMVIFYNSNHNHNNSMLSVCICELVDTCVKFTLWMRHGRVENVVRVSSMSLQCHFNEFWQARKFKMYDILMLFIAVRYRDCYTHQH